MPPVCERRACPLIPCMRLCPFTLYSLIARARTAPAEFPAKTAAHARRSAARSNRCHLPNARTYPTRMSAVPSRIIHSRNGMHKKMSSMPAAISAYPHIRPVQGLRIVLCLSSGQSSTQRTRSPPRFYLYASQPVQILRAVRAPHYPNGFRKCPAFSPLPLRNFPIKKKKPKVVPDLRLCRKGSHSSPLQQRS